MHLAQHKCFGYAYLSTADVWHYHNAAGEQVSVRPAGQLRVNNGEAVLPSVIAGLGIADLPDFIAGEAIRSGEVEVILKGWSQPEAPTKGLLVCEIVQAQTENTALQLQAPRRCPGPVRP
jgi:DNA-binding transcriptional LysR family regulator